LGWKRAVLTSSVFRIGGKVKKKGGGRQKRKLLRRGRMRPGLHGQKKQGRRCEGREQNKQKGRKDRGT